ncbi:MAG: DPP IV N-terminal domain-containing protein [Bifidobacterium sp.]
MDRYDGFWWSPDSKYVLFETYDESPEPIWHLSDPANPANPARSNRYPQALTANANVRLTLLELGFDSDNCCYGQSPMRCSGTMKPTNTWPQSAGRAGMSRSSCARPTPAARSGARHPRGRTDCHHARCGKRIHRR